MLKIIIEQISFWGAVIGSLLLALNISLNGVGYLFFLASSVASLFLLKDSNASKAITYQIFFFLVVNIIGIFRWLL